MKFRQSSHRLLRLFPLCLGFFSLGGAYADQNLAGNVTVTGGSTSGNLNTTGSVDVEGPVIILVQSGRAPWATA